MKITKCLRLAAIAACLPAMSVVLTGMQTSNQDTTAGYLLEHLETYAGPNSVFTHGPLFGSVISDSTLEMNLQLIGAHDYTFIAACDSDCDDVDLAAYEGSSLIDDDTLGDDYPLVTISATRDMEITLEIKMYSCATEWCDVVMVGYRD